LNDEQNPNVTIGPKRVRRTRAERRMRKNDAINREKLEHSPNDDTNNANKTTYKANRPQMTQARKEVLEEFNKTGTKFTCSICKQVHLPDNYSINQMRRADLDQIVCLDCQEKIANG